MTEYQIRLLITAIIAVVSLVIALWHNSVWAQKNTGKLGFAWGYFTIYSTVIGNILIFGYLLLVGLDYNDGGLVATGLVGLVASGVVAYFAANRRKWALLLSTLLSFNPLWFVINIFYLKNRWSEISSENHVASGGKTMNLDGVKSKMTKDIRLAIFLSASWLICVPLYVFIFSPYGRYMNSSDINHMISVMFFPVVVGLALLVAYKKWV